MSTLNITILTDGAAFHSEHLDPALALRTEVLAIVARMGRQIYQGENSGTLRDSNGNTCGRWTLTDA